jgi:hypothetical protein
MAVSQMQPPPVPFMPMPPQGIPINTKFDLNTMPFHSQPGTIKYTNDLKIKEDYFPDPSHSESQASTPGKELLKKGEMRYEKSSSSGESQDEVQMEMVDAEQYDILMGNFKKKEKSRSSANFTLLGNHKVTNTAIPQTNVGLQKRGEEEDFSLGQKRKASKSMLISRGDNDKRGDNPRSSITSSILSDNNLGNITSFDAKFLSSLNFQERNQNF